MKKYEHGGQVWQGNPAEWLDFSANINPAGCPLQIEETLRNAIESVVYYPDASMSDAIQQLSAFVGVQPNNVLPTAGGIDALQQAIGTIRPRRLVILTPVFVEYEHIGDIYGIPMCFHAIINEERTLQIDLEALRSAITARDLLIICNPINPVGTAFDLPFIQHLLEITTSANAWMLIDEAFIHYSPACSAKSMVAVHENLLIAGSMTKLFAIPGVRLGYLLAHETAMKTLKEKQMPWRISAFANAVCGVLAELDSFVEESLQANYHNREWMNRELTQMGIRVFPSQANFLLLDLMPINLTARDLAQELKKHTILIRNCENYRALDAYFARVAVKSETQNRQLLEHIRIIVEGRQ